MRSRSRSRYRGASSHGKASMTCWAVHSAVGCSVMLKWTRRRRSWARMSRTNSTLWVTVGTTKKSRATRSCTWFFKKVFHVGDDGLRGRTRYVSTVDLATSMPSFCSSPTIRGEPQVGFACHIVWISSRTSLATAGRPGVPCWLKRRQWSRKRWCCQAMTVRGWTNARASCQPGQRRDSHAQNRRSVATEARAMDGLLVDRELMPQRQVFQAQGCP